LYFWWVRKLLFYFWWVRKLLLYFWCVQIFFTTDAAAVAAAAVTFALAVAGDAPIGFALTAAFAAALADGRRKRLRISCCFAV
jgi:hypothetical protein